MMLDSVGILEFRGPKITAFASPSHKHLEAEQKLLQRGLKAVCQLWTIGRSKVAPKSSQRIFMQPRRKATLGVLASSPQATGGPTYSGQSTQPKSDLYKDQAEAYVKWRPTYPPSFLTGQAASGFAPHFDQVIATDVSPWQIAQAPRISNVTYKVTSADMGIEELSEVLGGFATADLVTIASALHFFDVRKLTELVLTALKPSGVYAPFTYNMPSFATPRLDEAMEAILVTMAGANYREEAAKRECNPLDGYEHMYFPFDPIEGREDTRPQLREMRFTWRFENVMGFMSSTSYIKRLAELPTGRDLLKELEEAWMEGGQKQEVVFKLWSREGRKPG